MGYLLCDDVLSLYTAMFDDLAANPPAAEGLKVAAPLAEMCQHQLAVACISAMQGRMSDLWMQTRRALEGCAIARICLEDGAAAKIWLETQLEDRKEVRERFSTRNMFPRDCADMVELGKRFHTCSAGTHASLHSISTAFLAMDPKTKAPVSVTSKSLTHPRSSRVICG